MTAEVRSVIDVHSASLFSNCKALKSVTLSKINRLVNSSFYNCKELEEIVYEGTMEEWNAIPKGETWDFETGNFVVRCTDGVIEKEQSSS